MSNNVHLINVLIVLINCYVLVNLNGDFSRLKRQQNGDDIDNTIIELFNDCNCVYHYQCSDNNTVVTNGENLINVRLKGDTTPAPATPTCKGGKFEGEIICCKLNGTSSKIKIDFDNNTKSESHQCGVQRTKINVRVFTDEDTISIDGEFPWIAAIYKKKKNGNGWRFHSSGSLIHPKVILTANHYFHRSKPENFRIILNGNIELPEIGKNPNQERDIIEIVNHPQYYGGALHNDGALLILNKPLESSKTNSLNSICLPPDNLIDTGRCLVAGWGQGSEEDDVKVLKKVELPLINFNKCQELLRNTRLGSDFELHKSFMCAGGEKDKDACMGDGGSPLMCLLPSETRYYHAGIVSWGIGCGQEDVPGVYASTFKMKQWILDELKERNLKL